MRLKVYADETRPLLQGARLTAFELAADDIDVTVICDSMASQVMKKRLGAGGARGLRPRGEKRGCMQ